MIYADHAATTQLSPTALQAMLPYLEGDYANASQPYAFARNAKKALVHARETVAACIGAKPEEIYFTSGGTESDNWALKGVMLAPGEGGAIVTSAFEHHAVLRACSALQRQGRTVAYVAPNASGLVTPESLGAQITRDVRLVSVMAANNELGTVQPIRALCESAHRHGALFHTDAVQLVGHMPVDTESLRVDLLSASAHKFGGPKGVGFLYIRQGTPICPYADGGAQEAGLRAGTENVAGIVGMAVALQQSVFALDERSAHLRNLTDRLTGGLRALPCVCFGTGLTLLPGFVSVAFPGHDGEALLHRLDLMGICVSTGSACDSKRTVISHVLRAVGMDPALARGTIRISLGYENTAQDVDEILCALRKILLR